jgi:hypothetical protein
MKENKVIPKVLKVFSVYALSIFFNKSVSRHEMIRSYEKLENPRPRFITVAVAPNAGAAEKPENTELTTNKAAVSDELTYLTVDILESKILSHLNLFFACVFITLFAILNFVLILIPAARPNDK